eukprot:4981922-Amphidinium_carterae.1
MDPLTRTPASSPSALATRTWPTAALVLWLLSLVLLLLLLAVRWLLPLMLSEFWAIPMARNCSPKRAGCTHW